MYPRVIEEIFAECGLDFHAAVKQVKLDPQYRILFGAGGEMLCTPDVARMEQQVARISAADARQFRRFLDDNRRKLALSKPCLETPFLDLGDVFSARLMKMLPVLWPWLSLDAELGRYFRDARTRLAFSFQSKYLGMSPFRCPSLFSILSFLEYEYGVYHPLGGCHAVSEAMAKAAEELGAKIRLEEPVTELRFAGRRPVAARTAQAEYPCDALVINADFARAMARLVPDGLRRRWSDAALARKRFSCSTFMLYLGIEGRYDIPHHNIYIAANYEQNLDEIERQHVLSADPSFYVQNACITDPSLAPAGMSTLYVLVPVTHMHPNVDWASERDRFREVVLRQMPKAGITDLEKRIRVERVITPVDWDQQVEIQRGATFNLAHNIGQMLYFRPHNRFEELDATYLVGGGTHPGSGLPVIYESARISSRLLLADLGVAAPGAVAEREPTPV